LRPLDSSSNNGKKGPLPKGNCGGEETPIEDEPKGRVSLED